jgi:translation initiation factor IF-3
MHPQSASHDIAFKTKRIREFLADGAKVRLRVRFRGRQKSNPKPGQELLERVVAGLSDIAIVEQAPTIEEGASSVFVLLAPKAPERRRADVSSEAAAIMPAATEAE